MSGIKERREGKAKAAPAGTAHDSTANGSTAQVNTAQAGTGQTGTGQANMTQASMAQTATAPATSAAAEAPQDNVRTRELKSMEQMGAGILWALFAVDEVAKEDNRVPKLVHAAKLFLIAVICIAPVLLMWQHAF